MSSSERTALLRNTINDIKGEINMTSKKQKLKMKIDLTEMPDSEKIKVIHDLRQSLRQKIAEEKLWQCLLNMENVVINGETIQWKDVELKGLTIDKL
jgi:hypothetical protein